MFQILGLLIVGLIIGALARALLPGRQKIGLGLTLLLGVLGAVIGGMIASAIGSGGVFELNIIGFVVAVASAVGLLAVAQMAGIGRGERRRELER